MFLIRFLAPILFVLCAAFCVWKRSSKWPFVVAICVAVAVAVWQIVLVVSSMEGRVWDPVFHGLKVGALVLVVGVDLAAAGVALRTMLLQSGAGQSERRLARWAGATGVLLFSAGLLYMASVYLLATSGE